MENAPDSQVAIVEKKANPFELVVAENEFDLVSATPILDPFTAFLARAEEWRVKVAAIKVTDISQAREMKLARETRLALKDIRVEANKKRQSMKDESLRRSRMIDGAYNIVEGLITPLESSLLAQEQFIERKEAERKAKLKTEREALLKPYGADTSFYDLGSMDDATFKDLLDGLRISAERKAEEKKAADAKKAEETKAENDRLAKLKAENDRLKAEKEAADKKAKEAADAAAAEARKKQAELDEANRKVKAAEAAAAAEKKRIADEAAAETKRLQEAARKAALAPDKDKLLLLAKWIRAFQVPEMMSADGINAQIDILERIDELASFVEGVAAKF